MASMTGSGKTAAFCIPIIQIVHETLRDICDGKTTKVSLFHHPFNLLIVIILGKVIVVTNSCTMENELLRSWKCVSCYTRWIPLSIS